MKTLLKMNLILPGGKSLENSKNNDNNQKKKEVPKTKPKKIKHSVIKSLPKR